MIFLLDTNSIADILTSQVGVTREMQLHIAQGDTLGLCRPVYYEVFRGLLWRNATNKLAFFNHHIGLFFTWLDLIDVDWGQAAQFWASARSRGKQLVDIDVLLAALAYRLNATIVSSDQDFAALPIRRINWRTP